MLTVLNKVLLQTRYVVTTHNIAKKLGKVGGRKGVLVFNIYYKD